MRENYVDVAKGLAMLLVIRIHVEIFGDIHFPYPVVAVPFFFFLSGFYDHTDKPVSQWLRKDFSSLILTSFIWGVITVIYVNFLHIIRTGESSYYQFLTMDKPLIGLGTTWFLVALFYAKIFTGVLNRMPINKYVKIVCVIITGAIISKYNLPFLIDEGISALPFYYTGKVVHPYIKQLISYTTLIIVGGIGLFTTSSTWYPYVLVNLSAGFSAIYYPFYFLIACLSFVCILWVCNKLSAMLWLAEYGKYTLGILVLHPLLSHTCAVILKRVLIPMSNAYIVSFLLAYVFICVGSYYISVWITNHLPFLFGKLETKTVNEPCQ